MRKIIYIINPISGTHSKKEITDLITRKTTAQKISFSVYPSVANGDYSFLKDTILEEKITDIIIAGGDGTVSQVVSSLMSMPVNFGILPCGSGNGLAFTAKIPKNLSRSLDLVFKAKAKPIDGFYVNDQFACMLCGLGFDAKVAHDFAQKSKRGLGTYIRQVVKNFFSAQSYLFELTLGQKTISIDAYLISIANSNQFGNNVTIAPEASMSDGLLDVVIVTNQHKLKVLLQTIKQIRGRNKLTDGIEEKSKGVIYFQTNKISIKNLSAAPLHIDGDPAESPEAVVIEIKKKCFRLIQP